MTEPTSLAEWRVKRRLKRAREWAETLGACIYCGDEFLWKDRQNHHCLKD
jgi:hypothetical protein